MTVIRVKLKTTMADVEGTITAGSVVTMDAKRAEPLIAGGYAVEVKEAPAVIEKAVAPMTEKATAPAPEANKPEPPADVDADVKTPAKRGRKPKKTAAGA